jgi:hypothetical protein
MRVLKQIFRCERPERLVRPAFNASFEEKLHFLRDKQIQNFLEYSWGRRTLYVWFNSVLVIFGLAFGAIVTVTGSMNIDVLPGIFGALTTFVLGIQGAFQFPRVATVWEQKHNEAKGLRDKLVYQVKTEEQLNDIVNNWISLREGLVSSLPAYKGLEEPTEGDRASDN